MTEASLPKRDWILLPLVGLLTICLVTISGELIARQVFSPQRSSLYSCSSASGPSGSIRGIPNSVCSEDGSLTGHVEYRFNGFGYRAGMELGAKPPGTYRIVMTGSSIAFGEYVRRESTIAALLPTELSRLTGRKVELYNEGMIIGFPRSVSLRFDDLVAANPDMILWIVTTVDVERVSQLSFDREVPYKRGLASGALKMLKSSRAGMLLEQFVYKSKNRSVKHYLMGAASPEFLRASMGAARLRRQLEEFDSYVAEIEGRATAAGVPVVVVMVPDRREVATISMGEWPAGDDPYKLGDEVRAIVVRHGGTYVDILSDFRDVPNPELHFFPILNHPDADGHAIISRLLAKELTSGSIPALKPGTQMQIAPEKGP